MTCEPRSLEFHASPPPGHWINDPNGLVFTGGRYRLFVQHRDDVPDFAVTGWARFSSDDLLHWEWDGPVLVPDASGWAYSGSVLPAPDGTLTAYHTRHQNNAEQGSLQTQHRAISRDTGLTWRTDVQAIASQGRNVRDPFVFRHAPTGDLRMLLARPCDWNDWADEPPSSIEILSSTDGAAWTSVGTIGPWDPPGIMWEVPLLLDFVSCWALIVSTVDRRSTTRCGVRYWLGDFDGRIFVPHSRQSSGGIPLDLGPDFYAAMANTQSDWPLPGRLILGWASSWATARIADWPGGMAGGPISLPRQLTLNEAGSRLLQHPLPASRDRATGAYLTGDRSFSLILTTVSAQLTIRCEAAAGTIQITRVAVQPKFDWNDTHFAALTRNDDRRLCLFIDGPLIELFIEPDGYVVTAVLPGGSPAIELNID